MFVLECYKEPIYQNGENSIETLEELEQNLNDNSYFESEDKKNLHSVHQFLSDLRIRDDDENDEIDSEAEQMLALGLPLSFGAIKQKQQPKKESTEVDNKEKEPAGLNNR